MKNKNWKTEFKKLEDSENWNPAIELLLKVIEENPNEKDAYLFMHYFFMEFFLDTEDYLSRSRNNDYYSFLFEKYFKIAYEKYKDDAEYLFWASIIMLYCDWCFSGYYDDNEHKRMVEKACLLNPKNILYKSYLYPYSKFILNFLQDELWPTLSDDYKRYSNNFIRKEKLELFIYMKEMNDENSEIRKEIASKGSLGKFFLETERFNIEESLQYKEL